MSDYYDNYCVIFSIFIYFKNYIKFQLKFENFLRSIIIANSETHLC